MSKCKFCHRQKELLFASKLFNENSVVSGTVKIPLDSRYLEMIISGESIFVGRIEVKKKIRFCPMCGRDLKESNNE